MSREAPQVFIYGSCVSRDTFEFLRPQGHGLVDYVARQSLISAFAPADPEVIGPVAAESTFQRRMMQNDWRGTLADTLAATAGRTDVLLWDLCDERLGVRALDAGGYLTRSVDLVSTGVDARLDAVSRTIDLGTPEHEQLWSEALVRWRAVLDAAGLVDRVVLLAPPWAASAVDGTPSPTSFGRTPEAANHLFTPYHRSIVNLFDCPVVTIDGGEARSDQGHRWGFAPFHYSVDSYVSMADDIAAATHTVLGDS